MFARPPLDYRHWIKIGLPPRLPESVPGCPGPWATPFCPFLAKTGGSRWDFFCRDYFSSSRIQTVYMGLITGVYFSSTTSYVVKTGDLFLLEVIQDPISRAHHLSAPPKSHCVASNNRMYSHLSLIPQRSRTNALRCASVDSHGSYALHCCTYPNCGTCPTLPGAHATNLKSRLYIFFSCLQQALAYLLTVYEQRSYSMTAVHSTTTYNPT